MSFIEMNLRVHKNIRLTDSPSPFNSIPGIKKGGSLILTTVVQNLPPDSEATLKISLKTFSEAKGVCGYREALPICLAPSPSRGPSVPLPSPSHCSSELEVKVNGYGETVLRFAVNAGTDDHKRKEMIYSTVLVKLMVGGVCVKEAESPKCVVYCKRLATLPWESLEKTGKGKKNLKKEWGFEFRCGSCRSAENCGCKFLLSSSPSPRGPSFFSSPPPSFSFAPSPLVPRSPSPPPMDYSSSDDGVEPLLSSSSPFSIDDDSSLEPLPFEEFFDCSPFPPLGNNFFFSN